MGKYNLNEISNLFELHSRNDRCELNHILAKVDGSGKRAATRMLYMRLLAISVNSKTSEQNWILKPTKTMAKPENVEEWLTDEGTCGIKSKDLLLMFKASTYKFAFKFLVDNELLFFDKFNRMWLKYPVGGKMLSLNYAVIAIKSSYKKDTSLDTQGANGVESEVGSEQEDPSTITDEQFWNK